MYTLLSIYIPWPFPPVWGVADNTDIYIFTETLTFSYYSVMFWEYCMCVKHIDILLGINTYKV